MPQVSPRRSHRSAMVPPMAEPEGVHLALVETAGNQRYIFSTNKLGENVGASQLVWAAGARWVPEALAAEVGVDVDALDGCRVDTDGHEVVVAASGKAVLAATDPGLLERVIRRVTERALIEAPGLDVAGAVTGAVPWGTPGAVAAALAGLHRDMSTVRALRPPAQLRSPQLPPVARCRTSGLPAAGLRRGEERSAASLARLDAAAEGLDRLRAEIRAPRGVVAREVDQLDDTAAEEGSWLAVIHADGNSLGARFIDLGADRPSREALDLHRDLSAAVDRAGREALTAAVGTVVDHNRNLEARGAPGVRGPWLVPLVLGGDDLTVVCSARAAPLLVTTYLTEFARRTGSDPAFAGDPVGACAGVAFVKYAFPFSSAYDLAEDLTVSAKRVKELIGPQACAVDFHVQLDASGGDLASIRGRRDRAAGAALSGGPWVVHTGGAHDGLAGRTWDDLAGCVVRLSERDTDGRRVLPATQLHAVRTALFAGRAVADAAWDRVGRRYPEARDLPGLWRDDGSTWLLDALSLADVAGPQWLTADGAHR